MTDKRGSVVFRADASEELGIGHVIRSLTLGKAVKELGWRVVLATRALPPDLVKRARAAQFEVTHLGQHQNDRDDATEIIDIGPEIVIADSHRLQPRFLRTVSEMGVLLCLVDDNGENDHSSADVVLNQNPSADADSYGPPSRNPRLLLGLEYALVREEITAEQGRSVGADGGRTVFVSMGGSDPLRLSEPIVGLLSSQSITTDVALGPATGDRAAVCRRLGELAHVTIVSDGDFARSLARATVAVIGAGTTMWEAACLGVPTVSVVVAPNQEQPSSAAALLGFTQAVDGRSNDAAQKIAQRVLRLLSDDAARLAMSLRGRSAVDGAGSVRVAKVVSDLAAQRGRTSC